MHQLVAWVFSQKGDKMMRNYYLFHARSKVGGAAVWSQWGNSLTLWKRTSIFKMHPKWCSTYCDAFY